MLLIVPSEVAGMLRVSDDAQNVLCKGLPPGNKGNDEEVSLSFCFPAVAEERERRQRPTYPKRYE